MSLPDRQSGPDLDGTTALTEEVLARVAAYVDGERSDATIDVLIADLMRETIEYSAQGW